MSVINQMLVDLERRRASNAERNRIPNHVRALPGGTTEERNRMPAALAALVIVAALGMTWWWISQRSPKAAQPIPVVPAKTALPAQADPEEMIAQRMSFELSNMPEALAPAPQAAPAGVATAAIVGRETAAAAPEPAVPATAVAAPARSAQARTADPAPKPAAAPRVEISKQVRELTPRQRADAEYAKGVAALHQGKSADARASFEAALQIVPAHHSARQALVGVLLDLRELADAARVLQEGLDIAPAQFGFAMALARLQVEQGSLDAGVQTLARSVDHAGSSPEYAAFYAGLLQRQQKHAQAVEMFERALRQRGNSGVWLLGMGLSLEALGRNAEAQEAYRRAKAAGNLPGDLAAFADQRLR